MIRSGTSVTVLLVFGGIGLSAFGAWHAYEREGQAMRDQFARDVDDHLHALEGEIETNLEVLHGLKALCEGSPAPDRRQFRVFARQALRRHPVIQALEWAPRVSVSERSACEEAARREGHAGFHITQVDAAGSRTPATERDEYFPVFFLEPLAGNESALGYDLASDPARREALELARERGTMQATAPIILVQEPAGQYGFLVLLPVHRAGGADDELRGFVVGVYRIPDLVRAALGGVADDVELSLIDGELSDRVIYRHSTLSSAPPAHPVQHRIALTVAGRRWTVAGLAGSDYVAARRSWAPQAGLVLGLLLTASLAAYVRVSASRTRAVKHLVDQRTRDLQEVNERLEQQRNILQSILDNLGDGVAVADRNGRLSMFNPAAEKILGLGMLDSGPEEWSKLYGLFGPDMVTPVPAEELPLARAVAGRASRDVELFVRNPERPGGVFIHVTATPIEHGKGGVAVFRDVSERKWAEAVLRDSEARFRSIVEATSSALVILSARHHIRDLNPQAERWFGVGRAEALGQDFLELCLPEEHRESTAAEIARVLAGERGSALELTVAKPGLPERTLLWSFSRLAGSAEREAVVIATGHDITERRQAEAARRVRELANRLQAAREAERAHLAREIHDELGQALTGLKYEVSFVSRQIAEANPSMREHLEGVGRMIDDTIVSLRRIAADLRPLILDELGLFAAIRWLAREFEQRTRIPCGVELPESQPELSRDRATAVFRILQEALTNVARHAAASRVEVRVRRAEDRVVLEVLDDGRGITADQAAAWESFGLLGMQERAAMAGGSLEIRAVEPRGTSVKVTMPY